MLAKPHIPDSNLPSVSPSDDARVMRIMRGWHDAKTVPDYGANS